MEDLQELVGKLNGLKIMQGSGDWMEGLPEELYKQHFVDCAKSAAGLNVDKHRWYELSTTVYATLGGFLGVRSVTDSFSENGSVEDYCHTLEFFEMEPIQKTSYERKKK